MFPKYFLKSKKETENQTEDLNKKLKEIKSEQTKLKIQRTKFKNFVEKNKEKEKELNIKEKYLARKEVEVDSKLDLILSQNKKQADEKEFLKQQIEVEKAKKAERKRQELLRPDKSKAITYLKEVEKGLLNLYPPTIEDINIAIIIDTAFDKFNLIMKETILKIKEE